MASLATLAAEVVAASVVMGLVVAGAKTMTMVKREVNGTVNKKT